MLRKRKLLKSKSKLEWAKTIEVLIVGELKMRNSKKRNINLRMILRDFLINT